MGAKDVKLHCNGDLAWSGIVEKGCGNQVFDYSMTIELTKSNTGTRSNYSSEAAQSHLLQTAGGEGEALPPTRGDTAGDMTRCKTRILETNIHQRENSMDEVVSTETQMDEWQLPQPTTSSNLPQTRAGIDDATADEREEPEFGASSTKSGQPKLDRCKTRLLKRSSDNLLLPTVDDSIQIYASTRSSLEAAKGET